MLWPLVVLLGLLSSAFGWTALSSVVRLSRRGVPQTFRAASTLPTREVPEGREAPPTELSLGAPKYRPLSNEYVTAGGIEVNVAVNTISEPDRTIERLVDALDSRLGALFASSYEFPGRYARWTLGFVNPPLRLEGRGKSFKVTALNDRGKVVLAAVESALTGHAHISELVRSSENEVTGTVSSAEGVSFAEEERSKQPSLFSVVRVLQVRGPGRLPDGTT